MQHVYVISGPCGCGKTTLATALAGSLADGPVCLIHGDDFQTWLTARSGRELPWPETLAFNWECILSVAGHALRRGLDVIVDYVVEDELPRLRALAAHHDAALRYVVLTASEETLRQRLAVRGDEWLTERALFLKKKLEHASENRGCLMDVTGLTTAQVLEMLRAHFDIV